jgi:hypothetical protein
MALSVNSEPDSVCFLSTPWGILMPNPQVFRKQRGKEEERERERETEQ